MPVLTPARHSTGQHALAAIVEGLDMTSFVW